MTATTWPQVTCTSCGEAGPGRAKTGQCKRCYARALHTVRPCAGCGATRRHLAAGPGPRSAPADLQLVDALTGYGDARGWAPETMRRARRALAAVLASGQDLGQPPWDGERVRRFLNGRGLVALRVVEFLTDQGLARANPQAVLGRWLAHRLAALPGSFAAEVQIWTEALQGRGPRPARPRHARTIEAYLRVLENPLTAWSACYKSLRQVTTDDVTGQLAPLTGATRLLALAAMRSLFTTLKARRVLFTNPAAPLTGRLSSHRRCCRSTTRCAHASWAW
jgi:hypothetical protein